MIHLILTVVFLDILAIGNVINNLLIGTVSPQLEVIFNCTLKRYDLGLGSDGLSMLWSAVSVLDKIGKLSGIVLILPIMDTRGRKYLIVHLRCFLAVTAAILQISSAYLYSAELFLGAVFLNGVIEPIRHAAVVLFVTEVAHDRNRGFFSTFALLGDSIGSITTYTLSRPSLLGNDNWAILPMITLCLTVPSYLFLCTIHDSPKWLMARGKMDEAKRSLRYYQGKNGDIDEEVCKIQKELKTSNGARLSWWDCLSIENIRKTFLIALALRLFVEIGPVNFENQFTIKIYGQLGVGAETIMTVSTICAVLGIVTGSISLVLLDKWGRRPLIGVVFLAAFTKDLIMAVCLWDSESGANEATFSIGILNRILSMIFVCAGSAVIPSLIIGELVTPAARVPVAQMSLFFAIAMAVPVAAIFPIVFDHFPPAMYIIFAAFHPIIITYVYRHLPETKNRSVCDIVSDVMESDHIPHRKSILSNFGEGSPLLAAVSIQKAYQSLDI